MTNFHVGQTVILERRSYRGPSKCEETTITRVGRKYAYIEFWGREYQFNLETGVEAGDRGLPDRIYTPEMKAAQDRRHAAQEALRNVGVRFDHGIERHLSTETLEAIRAAIPETERP